MNKKHDQPLTVVCAIIEQGNSFLVARRNDSVSQAGLWEFPGGKVEQNEQYDKALIREIAEELGCTIVVKQRLSSNIHEYSDKTIELIPYICSISTGTPHAHEHAQILWVNAQSALQLVWAPADIPILQSYLDNHYPQPV